jgi:hypothetical protein
MDEMMSNQMDDREVFNLLANPNEQYDEDWSMEAAVRDEGTRVGLNRWDSGDPGAGAGVSYVYLLRDFFFSQADSDMYGPYETFVEAADAVGLLGVNEATIEIFVDSKYRTQAMNALKLYDGLSNQQAFALFNSDHR